MPLGSIDKRCDSMKTFTICFGREKLHDRAQGRLDAASDWTIISWPCYEYIISQGLPKEQLVSRPQTEPAALGADCTPYLQPVGHILVDLAADQDDPKLRTETAYNQVVHVARGDLIDGIDILVGQPTLSKIYLPPPWVPKQNKLPSVFKRVRRLFSPKPRIDKPANFNFARLPDPRILGIFFRKQEIASNETVMEKLKQRNTLSQEEMYIIKQATTTDTTSASTSACASTSTSSSNAGPSPTRPPPPPLVTAPPAQGPEGQDS